MIQNATGKAYNLSVGFYAAVAQDELHNRRHLRLCQDRHQQPRRQSGVPKDLPRPLLQMMAPDLAQPQGPSGHASFMSMTRYANSNQLVTTSPGLSTELQLHNTASM